METTVRRFLWGWVTVGALFAVGVGLTADDLGFAPGARDLDHHLPVGGRTHALRRLVAARDLVGGLALALGAHAGIGRGQVLLGQVGPGQTHVDDIDAQ